jgi:hypothetical protein
MMLIPCYIYCTVNSIHHSLCPMFYPDLKFFMNSLREVVPLCTLTDTVFDGTLNVDKRQGIGSPSCNV